MTRPFERETVWTVRMLTWKQISQTQLQPFIAVNNCESICSTVSDILRQDLNIKRIRMLDKWHHRQRMLPTKPIV